MSKWRDGGISGSISAGDLLSVPDFARRVSDRGWRRRVSNHERWEIGALCALAAIAAALAGSHPTGSAPVDWVESGLVAIAITLSASRSGRALWLVSGAICVTFSRGLLLVPAFAVLGLAFASCFERDDEPVVGAVYGAGAAQVVLRWPPLWFHGFPSIMAGVVVAVLAIPAYAHCSPTVKRHIRRGLAAVGGLAVALSIPVVLGALHARTQLSDGQAAAETAFADLSGANSGLDTPQADGVSPAGGNLPNQAQGQLAVASYDFSAAASSSDQWWMAGARLVPVLAQHARLLAGASRVVAHVAASTESQVTALDFRNLRYTNGTISLTALEEAAAPAAAVSNELDLAASEMSRFDSPWLVAPIGDRYRSLLKRVRQAANDADLASEAATVVPGMLGADGPRHYFVAFMTPAESRGYDGFIGAYGELTAADGHVQLTRSGGIAQLEEALPRTGAILLGPTDYLRHYGSFHPGMYPQDVTYSPDLPSVSEVIGQMYPQAGGDHIDGVLAIDPFGLAALLQITGPIYLPGYPTALTSANVAQFLLIGQYAVFDSGATPQDAARQDQLEAAMKQAFDDLTAGTLPGPATLGHDLGPAIADGHISFWSLHPSEDPLVQRLNADGSFPRANGGDLLAVTTQNTGNNKIDAYLHSAIDDAVQYDPLTGSVSSTVTVTLRNDAPAAGLPPIVIDNPGQPGLAPGINRTWLTVYSPLALASVSVDGTTSTMTAEPELGVGAYSTYVDVPPGGQTVVTLHLVGHISKGPTYRMQARVQPSANPVAIDVSVGDAGKTGMRRCPLGSGMRPQCSVRFGN